MGRRTHSIWSFARTTLCASLVACQGIPASAPQDGDEPVAEDTVEGVTEVLIADYADRAETQYYLATADGSHLRVHFEIDPGTLQLGERLALSGHWNHGKSLRAKTFTATHVLKHLGVEREDRAAAGDGSETSFAALAAGTRAPMLHRVAVLMLGAPRYTRAEARAQVNQTVGSAASYITENSDGIDAFEGDVLGPYDVNTSDCENRAYAIADLARAAAASDGKDLSGYTNVAFLLPAGSSCGWAGLGQVGTPGSKTQHQTWYNNTFDCGVVAHELGHNLGMNHAHSTACRAAVYTAQRVACKDVEYGDVFDVMGMGNCATAGHYSVPQKQYMGWFADCEDVTAGGNAVFNLSPTEGSCGVRSLRIPISGESNYYYVEYRKRSAGTFGGTGGADRVLMSVSSDGSKLRPHLYRLDSTPQSSAGHRDGWLAPNTSYSLPGNVQIRVLEMADVARVQVTMPAAGGATCHNGEVPAADAGGRIGVDCGLIRRRDNGAR